MEKTFLAEIKNVTASKTVSNDKDVTVKFSTADSSVVDLGKLPPDTVVLVTVKVVSDKEMKEAKRTKTAKDFAFE